MTTDFRALCVELTDCLEKADWPLRHRYVFRQWIDIARAALADEPAVPKGREPVAVTGQPSDEEIMGLMPQQMHEDLAYAARAMANEAGTDNRKTKGFMRVALNRHAVDLARAVLSRWGRPMPVPPAKGEVAELVQDLHHAAEVDGWNGASPEWCQSMLRSAELLQRLSPPQPVQVSERLPGPEDCAPWPQPSDNSGWCWMSRTIHGFYGSFAIWEQVSVVPTCREVYTHWLPAHALPIPQQQETTNG